MEEIDCAVERVDNPFVLGGGFTVGAAFFASDFVMRIGFFKRFHQNHFGAAVNIEAKSLNALPSTLTASRLPAARIIICPALRAALKSGIKNDSWFSSNSGKIRPNAPNKAHKRLFIVSDAVKEHLTAWKKAV